MNKLRYVGVLSFATVDGEGNPQVRNISAIHYEPDALYFFTARGKDFCKELGWPGGRCKSWATPAIKRMIRLSGTARACAPPGSRRSGGIDFCGAALSLSNVYPGETRSIGMVFCIRGHGHRVLPTWG